MKLKKSSIAAGVIIIGLAAPLSANAGIYTDDLSRCMIESTSKKG